MPHITVKMHAGRAEEQKHKLADALTRAFTAVTGNGEDSVSVRIEDVAPSDWTGKVYTPDSQNGPSELCKRPGYGPRANKGKS